MKLIGLMPAKNEAWILRAAAEIALKWLDGIVLLNHASTDETEGIIDTLYREYAWSPLVSLDAGRVWALTIVDPSWDEMAHREDMLQCARRAGATHIALVDADEILTANLLGDIRGWIEGLETGEILQLPLYNLRGSLDHYHQTGLWGQRLVSIAFKDDPKLNWSGDQFHHREPMGLDLRAVRPVPQGVGGVMHLWGADLRRLRAKHALYKMTERVRWPEKPLQTIDELYSLWKGPKGNDPPWAIGHVPAEFWGNYPKDNIAIGEEPWQEAECRSLQAKFGSFTFKGLDLFGCTDAQFIDNAPRFSLCHATARPDGWRTAALAWFETCDHPEDVEYILAVDEGTDVTPLLDQLVFPNSRIVVNSKRRCSVDAWNEAARASSGKFLINLADDIRAPRHWDTELLRAIPNINQAYVLDVDTGGAAATLLPFSFLTRKYLERLTDAYGYEGGFFYPEYRGMYCDTEFTDLVRKDGVLINARHLLFDHLHPFFNKGEMDAVYQRQNAPEEYSYGRMLYEQRVQALGISGFAKQQSNKFVMTFCMPGETFSHLFMARWTELYSHLCVDWNVLPIFAYCSNVYVNRMTIWEAIRQHPIQPNLIVWVDDDNLVTVPQLSRLIQDLNEHPEADIVAGWCWINRGMSSADWGASCGRFDQDGIGHAFTAEEMIEGEDVKEVDFTGFPVILIRSSMLEKIRGSAFRPWTSDKHPWGFAGEDVSFCHWAKAAGARIFVDRRVRVQHLKLMDHGPATVQELARTSGNTKGEGVTV